MMKNAIHKWTAHLAILATSTLWPMVAIASPDDGSGGIFSTNVLVESALLILVAACAFTAFKVHNSVRGGRIAQGWQWFLMGFVVFAVAQVLSVGNEAAFIPVSGFWIGLLRIGALVIIFLGATRMRRLLA